MVNIPVKPWELPAATPPSNASIVGGDGAVVQKYTPAQIVDVAAPLASQGDAESGTGNSNRMSSLRVKQAIDARGYDAAIAARATTADLASKATGKGANLSGFSQDASYDPGTVGSRLGALRYVTDDPFLADATGAVDSSEGMQDALTGEVAIIPKGTFQTDEAITGEMRAISFGATFTGDHPLDEDYPAFGPGAFKVIARGTYLNSIIGIAHNTAPASTTTFPTGVTAYGRNDNAGNLVFGIYAEARQYASTGVACNEIDSFNHTAAPSTNLPPNLSIGTTENHPIGLQVGAGGSFNSSIGIHICQEGSSPQKFITGLYLNPSAVVTYGIFLDSLSTSTHTPLVVKHSTAQLGVQIIGVGSPVGGNPALTITDGGGTERFAFLQSGVLRMSGAVIATTVGAAGGASALPATPSGYILMNLGGTDVKVPFYAP